MIDKMWGGTATASRRECRFASALGQRQHELMKADVGHGLWTEEFFTLEPKELGGDPSG